MNPPSHDVDTHPTPEPDPNEILDVLDVLGHLHPDDLAEAAAAEAAIDAAEHAAHTPADPPSTRPPSLWRRLASPRTLLSSDLDTVEGRGEKKPKKKKKKKRPKSLK